MFFLCKILHQPGFDVQDGLVHGLMAFQTFGQNVDPFAAAVIEICPELDKALLFQPGQKTGNGGMAHMEGFLNIPGAGGLFLTGQKTHNVTLGSGEVHVIKGCSHSLIGTPVQDPGQMAVMELQNDHLLKCSVLHKTF